VGEDQSQTGRRRLTVAEAAEVLGITVEAVRGRIKRGTLQHGREGDRVFVLLHADQPHDRPRPDTDQAADRPQSATEALISQMQARIDSLEHQLEVTEQAHSETRMALVEALSKIPPAIEAPSFAVREAPDAAETVEEAPDRAEPHSPASGAQEDARRPWWRKVFGS
jgi:hypothetical protein